MAYNEKRETWLFRKLAEYLDRPIFERLNYNYVSFDNDPQQYIEPVNFAGELIDGGEAELLQGNRGGNRPRVVHFDFSFPAADLHDF